jgi:hypothetical protein
VKAVQRNGVFFQSDPLVGLTQHDRLIFDYLVDEKKLSPKDAMSRLSDKHDLEILELKMIESPNQHKP